MPRNQKLAPLLAGRVVAAAEPPAANAAPPASAFVPSSAATWHVHFRDGSVLAVRTDGTPPQGLDGAHDVAVADVTQKGTTLTLAFGARGAPNSGGVPALVFQTAEVGGCVMLRDDKGGMEYAD